MEHTPGPWRSQWSKTLGITGYDILGPDNVAIAGICDMVGSPLPLEANARLIAAAPELLEMLEYIVGMLADGGMPSGSDITNGKRAILAAKGEAND